MKSEAKSWKPAEEWAGVKDKGSEVSERSLRGMLKELQNVRANQDLRNPGVRNNISLAGPRLWKQNEALS